MKLAPDDAELDGRLVFRTRFCLAKSCVAEGLRIAALDAIDYVETERVRPIVLHRRSKADASRPHLDPSPERRACVFSPRKPANNEGTHGSTADHVRLSKHPATARGVAIGEENVPLAPDGHPTSGDVNQDPSTDGWELLTIFARAAPACDEPLQLLR